MQVDPDFVDDQAQPRDVFRSNTGDRRATPARQARLREDVDVFAAIAIGGGIGSVARYGIGELVPPDVNGIPWPTLVVNLTGCLLIGVLMVLVTDVWPGGRYARPFLGIGVLGGLTTYSTMMLELRGLGAGRDWLVANLYLGVTLVGGFVGVWVGVTGTRLLTRVRVRRDRCSQ